MSSRAPRSQWKLPSRSPKRDCRSQALALTVWLKSALYALFVATGGTGSTNADFLQFDFVGGQAGLDFVQSISIDLNAGPENDAVFDPVGGNADGRGPNLSSFVGTGFDSADVNVEPDPNENTSGTLSLAFGAGSFTVGSSFDLDIDIGTKNALARALLGGLSMSVACTIFIVPAAFMLVYRNRRTL